MTTENENEPVVRRLMREVSDNPTQITWPRDQWGFTSELKKIVIQTAGNVRGHEEKHDLLLNTLAVAIAHVQKRRAKDLRLRELSRSANKRAVADRLPRQQYSIAPANAATE